MDVPTYIDYREQLLAHNDVWPHYKSVSPFLSMAAAAL